MSEESLERAVRVTTGRVTASVISVVLFVGLVLNAYFIERVTQVGLVAVLPLTAAVLLLPGNRRSGRLEGVADGAAGPLVERQRRLLSLATTLRMIYLGVALICFFILPSWVPAPTG